MGSYGVYLRDGSSKGIKEFFHKEYENDFQEGKTKVTILAENISNGCWYAAVEYKTCEEDREVIAYVVRFSYKKSTGDFWYKPMSENMHPYYYGASKKVISALTKTNDENSNNWRKQCLEPKTNFLLPKENQIVVFKEPIKFNNGFKSNRFKRISSRKLLFKSIDENGNESFPNFRIRNWAFKTIDYSLL